MAVTQEYPGNELIEENNMRGFLRKIAYRFTKKRIREENLELTEIKIDKKDISYFNLSTNSIMSFELDGILYYFRECSEVYGKRDFFKKEIDHFFDSIGYIGICATHFKQQLPIRVIFSEQETRDFEEYIHQKMADSKFLYRFSRTADICRKINFSIWEKGLQTDHTFFDMFGLYDLEPILFDIATYFVWCMRSAANKYQTLKFVRGKCYSYFHAVRAVGSYVVAEELGLSHMITRPCWCRLHISNGQTLFGVLSESAPGERMKDTEPICDSSLQRELLNLNLLDVICNQPDHGPNNYNVCRQNGAYTVCAFDNDNEQTFFPFFQINNSLSGCSPFINGNGILNRPGIDAETVNKLNDLNVKAFKRRLKPYLNGLQLLALDVRIKKLKKAFRNTCAIDDGFLQNTEDWDERILKKELSGVYGETYLTRAIRVNNDK